MRSACTARRRGYTASGSDLRSTAPTARRGYAASGYDRGITACGLRPGVHALADSGSTARENRGGLFANRTLTFRASDRPRPRSRPCRACGDRHAKNQALRP